MNLLFEPHDMQRQITPKENMYKVASIIVCIGYENRSIY